VNKTNPIYRLKAAVGKMLIVAFGVAIDLFDGKIVFADPRLIKGSEEMEKAVDIIIAEYINVIKKQKLQSMQDFFVEQTQITKDDNWQSFPLFLFGHGFDGNTDQCPETVRMLKGIDGMSAAMFSVLKAGARITPHRGPYKGVLRYHLGLIVPEPADSCYIIVDGVRAGWGKGKSLLFDDTHVHEACNFSENDRVVLFVDIIRPLPFPLNKINMVLFNAISHSEFISDVFKFYSKNKLEPKAQVANSVI
jgi:aspartyl/asparaginyl beta-hydroxylase (cupin superfamily)